MRGQNEEEHKGDESASGGEDVLWVPVGVRPQAPGEVSGSTRATSRLRGSVGDKELGCHGERGLSRNGTCVRMLGRNRCLLKGAIAMVQVW